MFKFELGETVYLVAEDRYSIHQGTIISRKIVECSEFDGRVNELETPSGVFGKNGNRLGVPCEKYEVKIDGIGLTNCYDVKHLYADPFGIVEVFTDKANKYL